MLIEHGNYSRQDFALTQDTEIRGGNWVLARVTTNGHALTLTGGNLAGLRVDGVKLDAYVWRRYESHPVAVAILDASHRYAGDDGVAAWLHGVQVVLSTGPELTYDGLKAAHVAWAMLPANNNLVHWDAAVQTIWAVFFPGLTWEQLLAAIRAYDLATWSGEPTLVVEEES